MERPVMTSDPSLRDDRQLLDKFSLRKKILLGFALYIPFSLVKKAIFKHYGAHIGKNVFFGPGSIVLSNDFKNITIGDNSFVGPGVMMSVNHLVIGPDSTIGYQCLFVGDYLNIGSGCNISNRSFIESSYAPVTLGNSVTIGASAIISSHDGAYTQTFGHEMKKKAIHIKNGAFIGNSAILLPGIEIGEQAIVGAGAVVTKSVESGVVVAGVPARIIKTDAGNQDANNVARENLSRH